MVYIFGPFQSVLVKLFQFSPIRSISTFFLFKRRYLRKEKKLKFQCTLNEKADAGVEGDKQDMLVGKKDIFLEEFLPLEETVDNEDVAKNLKLLSEKERKVVSLRLEEDMSVKEINIYLGTNRRNTSIEIYSRAINKIKNNIDEDKKGE